MIYFLLLIIILELGLNIYLCYKALPEEKKQEVRNRAIPNKVDVIEWSEPIPGEEEAFKGVLSHLKEDRR